MAGKAKALSDAQVKAALAYLREDARYPEKSQVLFLLSLKAGLRAKRMRNSFHGCGVRITSSRAPDATAASTHPKSCARESPILAQTSETPPIPTVSNRRRKSLAFGA